ncbi:MAG: peptidylprolyl isomerase [Desulfohalobiaceae bacterium]|nr:peptidylprolyl isomerase [Desulfohalobiaceae bacterium]
MTAKQGDSVKVHYHGTLNDGTVFDSTYEESPLDFTIGEGEIIPGFEEAVEGMDEGEKKNITVEPENAYGEYNERGVVQVPRENLPEDIQPEKGMMLQLNTPEDQVVYVTVTEIDEENVTLDANHPLAGKTLNFDIELLQVNPTSE